MMWTKQQVLLVKSMKEAWLEVGTAGVRPVEENMISIHLLNWHASVNLRLELLMQPHCSLTG